MNLAHAYKELKIIQNQFSDRLKIHNFALGNQNNKQELHYGSKDLKKHLNEQIQKLSFIEN